MMQATTTMQFSKIAPGDPALEREDLFTIGTLQFRGTGASVAAVATIGYLGFLSGPP